MNMVKFVRKIVNMKKRNIKGRQRKVVQKNGNDNMMSKKMLSGEVNDSSLL